MKTYAIYNSEKIKLVISTDDILQVKANLSTDDKFKEVDPCFSSGRHKIVNGDIVEKTLAELKQTLIF